MYKVKNGFIIRKIGEHCLAVPVGTQTSELHGMIALSESGELLWKRLENGATVDELAESLVQEYDVDFCTAENDVEEFLEQLRCQGALQ